MIAQCKIKKGGYHNDERGTIFFFNDFDITEVKRFYKIKHHDVSVIRGWRGHKIEQRWFHVYKGAFEIKLVEIDNWLLPNRDLAVTKFILTEEENVVLHIPSGFASSLKAITANSEVLVFADHAIELAKDDDYLFPSDYFNG